MAALSFDDLELLDDQSLKLVLQAVVYEQLLPALAFASEVLKERIFNMLAEKARDLLLEDLHSPDYITESDAAAAQIRIEAIMARLQQSHDLRLA